VTAFQPAFPDADLGDNESRALTLNGRSVLVCRAAGELYAVENRCTHQEAELEGGASAVASFLVRCTACDLISATVTPWAS
jgi:nitrite reductase/ring-hydroxylating ferredoxin subunit